MKKFQLVMLLGMLFSGTASFAQYSPAFSKVSQPANTAHAEAVDGGNVTSPDLPRFGTNIFSNINSTAANLAGTLPKDYHLGPGDYLGIYLGDKAQQYFDIRVSVDGQLFLPGIGVFYVNDLNLEEFNHLLDKKLQTYFSNYSLKVILIEPKFINVNIIGEVQLPGSYVSNGLKSVLDFISMANGVTDKGALRDIQIFRDDSLVQRIDLYDYLLRPTFAQNFSLQNGDRIFVPVAQEYVEVMGSVNRPAKYELNPHNKERLRDIIELAGDFTATALRSHVELIRTDANAETHIKQYNLAAAHDTLLAENPLLRGMDKIIVYSAEQLLPEQIVGIYGEVSEPGLYDWQENLRVSNLILRAGSLKRSAYLLFAEVARIDPNKSPILKKINLEAVLQGDLENDLLLEPDDKVFIRRIPEWIVGPTVEVVGEISFPGVYPIVKDSTKLSEILFQAGGFTKDALVNQTRLIRRHTELVEDKEFLRLSKMSRSDMTDMEYEYYMMKLASEYARDVVVDFDKLVYDGDKNQDVIMREGDMLVVPRKPDVVFVSGQVARPGGVIYDPGKSVRYYIQKAGGFSYDARKHKIRVIKVNGEIVNENSVTELLPGDRIWVPRKREVDYWEVFYKTIMTLGQLAAIYIVIYNTTNK